MTTYRILFQKRRDVLTDKTKLEILDDAVEELDKATTNIKDNLQANEIVLSYQDSLSLADKFFEMLQKKNSSVIVTGDSKRI